MQASSVVTSHALVTAHDSFAQSRPTRVAHRFSLASGLVLACALLSPSSAIAASSVDRDGLVSHCDQQIWPYDCEIMPGVEDPSLFQGDCSCDDLWFHEATGLYTCQELPSSCGGGTIFDIAGFPLSANVWDDVDHYDDGCCSGTACDDPLALAEVDGVVRDCEQRWTEHCALQLHLSRSTTVCEPPAQLPSWVEDGLFVQLGTATKALRYDDDHWPHKMELRDLDYLNEYGGRSYFKFEALGAKNGYYRIKVFDEGESQSAKLCVDEDLGASGNVIGYDVAPNFSGGSSGRKCHWKLQIMDDGKIALRSRFIEEAREAAGADYEVRESPQLGIYQPTGTLVMAQGAQAGEIPVAGAAEAPVRCYGQSGPCTSLTLSVHVPEYRVFASRRKYSGTIVGLAYGTADDDCTDEAHAAGLSGTYRAWQGYGSWSAADRLMSGARWKRVDGTLVARNKADLIDGRIQAPINLHADRTPLRMGERIWTLTGADGQTAESCFIGEDTGMTGIPYAVDRRWTEYRSEDCGNRHSVYCFEVKDGPFPY